MSAFCSNLLVRKSFKWLYIRKKQENDKVGNEKYYTGFNKKKLISLCFENKKISKFKYGHLLYLQAIDKKS